MDPTLITEEVEDTLEFGDTILNVQLGIRNFLERKRDIEVQHPVSQFQLNEKYSQRDSSPKGTCKATRDKHKNIQW